jgi:hypothetical protein
MVSKRVNAEGGQEQVSASSSHNSPDSHTNRLNEVTVSHSLTMTQRALSTLILQ